MYTFFGRIRSDRGSFSRALSLFLLECGVPSSGLCDDVREELGQKVIPRSRILILDYRKCNIYGALSSDRSRERMFTTGRILHWSEGLKSSRFHL